MSSTLIKSSTVRSSWLLTISVKGRRRSVRECPELATNDLEQLFRTPDGEQFGDFVENAPVFLDQLALFERRQPRRMSAIACACSSERKQSVAGRIAPASRPTARIAAGTRAIRARSPTPSPGPSTARACE
jgi:hypothetical protein